MTNSNRPARYILGLSGYYHDSAAALLCDGEIIAAAQEERFSRKKHDPRFPKHAILYCLKEAGITLQQVDQVVFYEKPLVKLERLAYNVFEQCSEGFPVLSCCYASLAQGKTLFKGCSQKGIGNGRWVQSV